MVAPADATVVLPRRPLRPHSLHLSYGEARIPCTVVRGVGGSRSDDRQRNARLVRRLRAATQRQLVRGETPCPGWGGAASLGGLRQHRGGAGPYRPDRVFPR